MRESWEAENASALREADALLAAAAADEVEPFEGAFGAYRLLQNGTTLPSVEEEMAARGEKLARLREWSLLRMVLGEMVHCWATRLRLRKRVERDIVGFARAWREHPQDPAGVDWPAWRRWLDPRASPFADQEPTPANGTAVQLADGQHADLQHVPRPGDLETLSLIDCTITSLDGIERFEQLHTLDLHDVKGPTDLSAIERLPALTSLTIATEHVPDPALVGTLDFARLPHLAYLSLQCFAEEPYEAIPVDTRWIPHAANLMDLILDGFVPASNTFDDIVAARRLINLRLTAKHGGELKPVLAALPLTDVSMTQIPTRAPRPGDFGMASTEGNRAVGAMVDTITAWLPTAAQPTADDLNERLGDGMAAIKDRGHAEVFDTAVREDIARSLKRTRSLSRAGLASGRPPASPPPRRSPPP